MRAFVGIAVAIAIAVAWSMLVSTCAVAEPSKLGSYAGRWAVKAEGQNLMVLVLDLPPGSSKITGTLYRPEHMNLVGRTVSSVSLPIAQERVSKADLCDEGLVLGIEGADGSVTEFDMELTGVDAANLKFRGAPAPALPLVRVAEDANVATDWIAGRSYVLTSVTSDNVEMTALYEQDQADRKVQSALTLEQLRAADTSRRETTRTLLTAGGLRTGLDYLHAAFVFQHGDGPTDFLLAHALATTALQMGRSDAGWIAAASLDRYLLADGKPQIYGTQFLGDKGQGDFDRALLPDSVRVQMGVPALSDQAPPPARTDDSWSSCPLIEGDDALWGNPSVKFILVGETHGTTQEPAFFANLVCDAHRSGRPIIAAVEQEEGEQHAIDSFISSDGGETAKQAFLRSKLWHLPIKDGRSSQAYFDLFVSLQRMYARGIISKVVAIQPLVDRAVEADGAGFNQAMANRIKTAGDRNPGALVIVLVGNLHARKKPLVVGDRTLIPAAAYLPPGQTISLIVSTDGDAWTCAGTNCGVRAVQGPPPIRRRIQLGDFAPAGFDGVIDLGELVAASLPATTQ